MILLQCVQVSKSFGTEEILSNVKLEIKSRERIALVGRNGAGKSTLLKIIIGELSYDSGDLIIPKDVRIGYLAQDSGLDSSKSIWDEMLTVFRPLIKIENHLRILEEKMSDPSQPNYEKVLQEYDQLQQDFKDRGGFQYEADIRGILSGLNFNHFEYQTPITSLSGGQKTRLALGKLLLSKPSLLILDEPTNHLDIQTLTWLEQYLTSYDGAILIVSHDRYFLDRVSDHVYELTFHRTTKYPGNYSQYLSEKAKRFELELKQFEKQQSERARLEEFVEKNLARASTSNRAKSRRKKLEKMDVLDTPKTENQSAKFLFNIKKQSGNDVLQINALSVGFNDVKLFDDISLKLNRGESVALIGPNGIGKSTLIKAIANKLTPMSGTIHYGSNVSIGYYDQEQTELTSNKTVLQELWDEYPQTNEKDIRTVLGNFLFSGEDVLKHVFDLSGGEKSRLALAKLMMQKANLLILDEPTNHLDIDSKEVLENALIDYPGTILFVSHDRYFVNRMATRVVELSSTSMTSYLGDYDYYIEKKFEKAELKRLEDEKTNQLQNKTDQYTDKASKSNYHLDKEQKKLERQKHRRIDELEKQVELEETLVAEIQDDLCDPEVFQDHEKSLKLNQQLEVKKGTIETLLEEWEFLQLDDE